MKKLIMLSFFALGTLAFANNEQGSILKRDANSASNQQYEGGCYQIVSTVVYSVNYSITNSTQSTHNQMFGSIAAVDAHIQSLKDANPDSVINGTGHRTFYTYTKVAITKCF